MARILNTDQINFAIAKIIREAKERVCIITPYISLHTWRQEWTSVMDELKVVSERKVHVILICRSFNDEIDSTSNRSYRQSLIDQQDKQRDALNRMYELVGDSAYLHIHYCPYLHAKCYFNETDTVLPSMNLTLSSVEHENKELGVLLKKGEDDDLLKQLFLYINEICDCSRPTMKWVNSEGKFQKRISNKEKLGYCIYCGRCIKYDTDNPVCASCKPEIERGYVPKQKYCHLCGELALKRDNIRITHPLHYSCWRTLQ